jgi:uncharacterized protein
MASTPTVAIDLARLAHGLPLPLDRIQTVIALLDAGNTVPFITRYRKDQTGGMDEEQIREIQLRLGRMRLLAERKQTILRSIESQGKLTPELAAAIEAAESTKRVEDLYLPYKPKKQTLATTARERGLEPLADEVLGADPAAADLESRAADFVNADKGLPGVADALLGVGHILAELFSERADVRQRLRKIFRKSGKLVSAKADNVDEKAAQGYRDYFAFNEPLGRVPPHRVLAINRGERSKMLKVKVDADLEAMQHFMDELVIPPEHPHADFLRGCARDALNRLVFPSLEREARREMTDNAETHAVEVFARNLRNLLLQPPVNSRRVLAVDPGFKSGCKLAALDEFGYLLDHAVVHIVGKAERRVDAKAKMVELINKHSLSLVAIGNGTACRESEELIGELLAEELKDQTVAYVIVNEAGASVYSTSPLGREEFPDYDATLRGAISIGRRLQDPLSELVKIDPANIGVGLYQHDVKAKHLRDSLDAVVESCVNYVGVDLNTASPALLRYVSGLNQLTARRVYDYRKEHGPFKSRAALKEVPGFGEATFVQAAGFLKIADGENPFDATWIHPESYPLAEQALQKLECTPADLRSKEQRAALSERTATLELEALAGDLQAGSMTLRDIVTQFTRPGRDPREDLPLPIFKKGVIKLDDLSPGMELSGTVLNVVDFGAFVDIGLHDTGLVHVSQLANRYVRDPHEVVSVGDIVKVWVHEIDKERRRVSLTMLPPGTERQAPGEGDDRRRRPRRGKPKGGQAGSQPTNGEQPAEGKPPGGGRPNRRRRGKKGGRPAEVSSQAGGATARTDRPAPTPPAPAAPPPIDRTPRPPKRRMEKRFGGGPGRPGGGKPRGGKPADEPMHATSATAVKSPPKPKALPERKLTEKMRQGKEPLRTFGDLLSLIKEDAPADDSAPPANE